MSGGASTSHSYFASYGADQAWEDHLRRNRDTCVKTVEARIHITWRLKFGDARRGVFESEKAYDTYYDPTGWRLLVLACSRLPISCLGHSHQ